MEQKEIWKDVDGFKDYQVSNLGRVKSNRRGKSKLIGCADTNGYLMVTLYTDSDGKKKNFRIHQLVAMVFLGHKPNGNTMVVNHIDGNKLNNNASNLEIVTNRENSSICYRKNEDAFTSSFVGVSWAKDRKKWVSVIEFMGEIIHLGSFDDETDAGNMYQEALKNIDNPKYFESIKQMFAPKYKYIYYNKERGKWVVQIRINGKQKHVGIFNTKIEAYEAIYRPTNNR